MRYMRTCNTWEIATAPSAEIELQEKSIDVICWLCFNAFISTMVPSSPMRLLLTFNDVTEPKYWCGDSQ
jgi:hypothetical protein